MNSLWDIRIFLGLVPKESPCTWQIFASHPSDVQTECETLLPPLVLETHCESSIFIFIFFLVLKEDNGKGKG
jgi:hypothetical protein